MDLKCGHCGSSNTEIEQKGTQTGLYCADCGKWIKWLNKDEIRVFNRSNNVKINTDTDESLKNLVKDLQNIIDKYKEN